MPVPPAKLECFETAWCLAINSQNRPAKQYCSFQGFIWLWSCNGFVVQFCFRVTHDMMTVYYGFIRNIKMKLQALILSRDAKR